MKYVHNKKRRVGKNVHTFTIDNKTYSIRLSDHAKTRLKQRNIDLFQTIGAILSLGESRITAYSGSDKDIFIQDKQHNFSVICNITGYTITIVTCIDNSDCFVKDGTIAINL